MWTLIIVLSLGTYVVEGMYSSLQDCEEAAFESSYVSYMCIHERD